MLFTDTVLNFVVWVRFVNLRTKNKFSYVDKLLRKGLTNSHEILCRSEDWIFFSQLLIGPLVLK